MAEGRDALPRSLLPGALALAVVPPALMVGGGARPAFVLAGALTWAAGVAVKGAVYRVASPALAGRGPVLAAATVRGAWSAVAELGSSALVLSWFRPPASTVDALAFGAGAGAAELCALTMVRVVLVRRGRTRAVRPPARSRASAIPRTRCARHLFLLERFGAMLLHMGSRALLAAALSRASAWPALVGAIGFAGVDGLAAYGKLRRWNWLDPRICSRFHGAVLATGAVQLACLAALSGR